MDKYEQTKDDYDAGIEWHYQKTHSYNWSKQLEILDQFIKTLKGKKVLDAGCGVGRDIELFLHHGIDVEGIDYSEEAIKMCRAQFPGVTFFVGDFRKMDVRDSYYDGIWACASILNISKRDLPSCLKEFLRTLKPGGVIFASVKEGEGEKMVADEYGERFFSFYVESELNRFFEDAGFKILSSEIVTDESLTGIASNKPNWIIICGKKNF